VSSVGSAVAVAAVVGCAGVGCAVIVVASVVVVAVDGAAVVGNAVPAVVDAAVAAVVYWRCECARAAAVGEATFDCFCRFIQRTPTNVFQAPPHVCCNNA